MASQRLKALLRRLEKERLPWFILISLLIHHASLTLFFHPPKVQDEALRPRWKIIELTPPPVEQEPGPVPASEIAIAPDGVVAADAKQVFLKEEPKEQKIKEEEEKQKKEEEKTEQEKTEAETIPLQGLHYVDVRSNPSDEPPEDAKYFAPQNSVVEEETRAENTNMDHDDGMSEPAQSELEDMKPGDADRDMAAHEVKEDKIVEQEKGNENKEGEDVIPTTKEPSSSQEEEGKREVAEEKLVMEIFKVTPVPLTPDNAPDVNLEKSEEGEIFDPETGQPVVSVTKFFSEAKKKKSVEGSEAKGEGMGKELDMPWKEFEGVFGKKMEEEKKAFEEAKKSHTKGGFTKNIDKVMSQLENFTPDVKPGNQTALNAAYHPFAEYITAFHRKLHPQWGDGYLYSLLSKSPGHPHNDMTLYAQLEFVVTADGMIDKATVVHTSGDLAYDVAAIDAVYGGQPYPPPPDIIKSYNGKVYLRWGFYRNESQCGVWNAEPYLIPAPSAPIKKIKKPPKEVAPK